MFVEFQESAEDRLIIKCEKVIIQLCNLKHAAYRQKIHWQLGGGTRLLAFVKEERYIKWKEMNKTKRHLKGS
jgi:hypothetical protein